MPVGVGEPGVDMSMIARPAPESAVFAVDMTFCPNFGGRLGLVAELSDPASIGRYLRGVGLAAEPPAVAAARPPPQRALDLFFFELDYSVFVVRRPLR